MMRTITKPDVLVFSIAGGSVLFLLALAAMLGAFFATVLTHPPHGLTDDKIDFIAAFWVFGLVFFIAGQTTLFVCWFLLRPLLSPLGESLAEMWSAYRTFCMRKGGAA